MTKSKPTLNQADINLLKHTFATKDDLKAFATKDDLRAFATKDDLADLKAVFATKDDVRQIVQEEIKSQVGKLPTKNEFFSRMDDLAGDYKKFTEETPVINHQLADHEDRLEVVETKLHISPA
jgi:hypothetical protein